MNEVLKALYEQFIETQDITNTNFDIEQYKADLQCAYDCGYNAGLSVLDDIRAEIRKWYWQADKQALAKDPCVVDIMVDLFIRTIIKYQAESEVEE